MNRNEQVDLTNIRGRFPLQECGKSIPWARVFIESPASSTTGDAGEVGGEFEVAGEGAAEAVGAANGPDGQRTLYVDRQTTGLDGHSRFANPEFIDAARTDYRLGPASPARKLRPDGGPVGAEMLWR
jgi:hypothetical protein